VSTICIDTNCVDLQINMRRKTVPPPPLNTEKSLGTLLSKQLGVRLALRRRERGWTQADLAEKLEVETETVSRFERGHAMPSLKRLAFAAYVMDVSLVDLIGGASHLAGDAAAEVLELFKDISPSQRMVLLGVLRDVSAEFAKSNQTKR
jgi:transcriptional regulator with XRE-family HTH domain